MHSRSSRPGGRASAPEQTFAANHVDMAVLAVQRMRDDCTLTYRQALRQVTAELDEREDEAVA